MTLVLALAIAPLMHAGSPHAEPGSDLPARGHSRLDELIGAGPVPFPFSRLVARINSQLAPAGTGLSPVKSVLIPLGRSLQRGAGAPEFFRFPRVVVAVDGATRPGIPPMKDRLFIGYHEKGAVLEVISYNEALGRFEYQLVRDYRPGGKPELVYARRALCLACHQNGAPIFARPLWDETPANPAIAQALEATGSRFYGMPMGGTDIAYLFDTATDRANLIPVWQQIWRDGCGDGPAGEDCRRDLFTAALAQALSGVPAPAGLLARAAPQLDRRWRQVWPQGLSLPNPDLPNRDPLAHASNGPSPRQAANVDGLPAELAGLPAIPARFDPLRPRPPLEVWPAPDRTRIVDGLAGLFADADLDTLDQALARGRGQTETLALTCMLKPKPGGRHVFQCDAPGIHLTGAYWPMAGEREGRIDRLSLPGTPAGLRLREEKAGAGSNRFSLLRGQRHARLADGRRLAALSLAQGAGSLSLVNDFSRVRERMPTLDATVFPAWNGMSQLLTHLGEGPRRPSPTRLPTPRADHSRAVGAGPVGLFRQHCGQCHDTPEPSPPNFLHGDARTVAAHLDQCAPRIVYRLSMWDVAEPHRGKTPMPPLSALAGQDGAAWAGSATRRQLLDHALELARTRGLALERIVTQPFERLPPCLPPGNTTQPGAQPGNHPGFHPGRTS